MTTPDSLSAFMAFTVFVKVSASTYIAVLVHDIRAGERLRLTRPGS